MIGLSRLYIALLITALFNGCGIFGWDNTEEFLYTVRLNNETNEELMIVMGETPTTDTIIVNAVSSYDYNTVAVFEKQNIIQDALFREGYRPFEERARIYINNILRANWKGPAEDKGQIHHFYNYTSWDSWLIDNTNTGVVQFTIYESDLIDK